RRLASAPRLRLDPRAHDRRPRRRRRPVDDAARRGRRLPRGLAAARRNAAGRRARRPRPANIRITSAGAGLLDWDEARVDYTDLDLADLPEGDPPSRYLPPAPLAGGPLVRPGRAGGQRRPGRPLLRTPPAGGAAALAPEPIETFRPRLDVAAG